MLIMHIPVPSYSDVRKLSTLIQIKSVIETSWIVHWQRGIKKYLVPWASDQSKQHTAYNIVSPQFDISLWFSYLCLKWQSM